MMSMKIRMASMGILGVALAAGLALAQEQPGQGRVDHGGKPGLKQADKPHHDKDKAKDSNKEKQGVKAGDTAPAISLKDTEGKEFTLAQFTKDGNIVVLEWFNPDCPFIKKHHVLNKTMNELHAKYSGKKVVFLAINSSAAGKEGSGLERNKKAKSEYGVPFPILLDESGEVGHAYGAKTTPHMFIIGADGKVAYNGALDDDTDPKTPGKVNYVAKALDEMLSKQPVSTTETRPYGCSVKYGAPKTEKQQ